MCVGKVLFRSHDCRSGFVELQYSHKKIGSIFINVLFDKHFIEWLPHVPHISLRTHYGKLSPFYRWENQGSA